MEATTVMNETRRNEFEFSNRLYNEVVANFKGDKHRNFKNWYSKAPWRTRNALSRAFKAVHDERISYNQNDLYSCFLYLLDLTLSDENELKNFEKLACIATFSSFLHAEDFFMAVEDYSGGTYDPKNYP